MLDWTLSTSIGAESSSCFCFPAADCGGCCSAWFSSQREPCCQEGKSYTSTNYSKPPINTFFGSALMNYLNVELLMPNT